MASSAEILKDPDFQGLPLEERRKVLLSVDPDFQGLPAIEQNKVLQFGQKIFEAGLPGQRESVPAGTPIDFPPTFAPAARAPEDPAKRPATLIERLSAATPKEVLGTTLPIAGDIVGSIVAPQLKGPQLLTKVPKTAKAINLAFRSLGAGTGAFTGSVAGQQIEKGEVDPKEALREGLLGAGGEAGLSVALKATRESLKASAKIAKDLTISGNKVKSFLSNQLIERTTKRASRFVDEVAPDIVTTQGGENIGRQIDEAMDENKLTYGRFKEVLVEAAGSEDGFILVDDLSQYLRDRMEFVDITPSKDPAIEFQRKAKGVIKELGFPLNSPQGAMLRKIMLGGSDTVTPNEVEFIFTNIFPKKNKEFFKLDPDTRKARENLKSALIDDVAKITSPTTGKTAADIKKEADEVFKAVKQFESIRRIYDQAIVKSETKADRINPGRLADLINRNAKNFKQSMPDVWPKLKAEADFYEGIAKRLKLGETGGIKDIGQIIGPGSLFFLGGLKGIAAVELFGAGSAWALLSDSGRATISAAQKVPLKQSLKVPLRFLGRELFGPSNGETQ
jgi:hypothetical protein